MRFNDGHLDLGRVSGVDLRVHWSVGLAMLVLAGPGFDPIAWLGFVFLVIVHELGHALLVRRAGLTVTALELSWAGGRCLWRGNTDALTRAWIAWGGVLAQLLLFAVAITCVWLWGPATAPWAASLSHVLLVTNLWIAGLNLLPIPPLDGAEAWTLPRLLRQRGVTPARLMVSPLRRWARDRRRRRARDAGEAPSEPPSSQPGPEEPELSRQAQRELASLLDRIADEAGRTIRKDK